MMSRGVKYKYNDMYTRCDVQGYSWWVIKNDIVNILTNISPIIMDTTGWYGVCAVGFK